MSRKKRKRNKIESKCVKKAISIKKSNEYRFLSGKVEDTSIEYEDGDICKRVE